MLKSIRVSPLAAESLGVRSMCTYVETPDVKILLDAGVSVSPNRFGLPPHPMEFKAIQEARRKIAEAAATAEMVTVSHYHFDHHTPSFEDWLSNWTERRLTARQIYEGKTVLMKNPQENINFSQRQRAWMFQQTGARQAGKLEAADGKTFTFGETLLKFSEAVPHGPENSALGWVVMTTVQHNGAKFTFAPDVQGPMAERTVDIIIHEKPQLLMLGGPPLYLSLLKVDEKHLQQGLGNIEKIVGTVPHVILDHHILRDEKWREKAAGVLEASCKVGGNVQTAAEFLGKDNTFLESVRKRLYEEEPPSKEFEKWMRESADARKKLKPPI